MVLKHECSLPFYVFASFETYFHFGSAVLLVLKHECTLVAITCTSCFLFVCLFVLFFFGSISLSDMEVHMRRSCGDPTSSGNEETGSRQTRSRQTEWKTQYTETFDRHTDRQTGSR